MKVADTNFITVANINVSGQPATPDSLPPVCPTPQSSQNQLASQPEAMGNGKYILLFLFTHSHNPVDNDCFSQSQTASPPPCNQLACHVTVTRARRALPVVQTPSTGESDYDPREVIAMAEAEYRAAERRLRRVQDLFSDGQGRQSGPFQSTVLFSAEQAFVRARNIRDFVRRVEGNNLNSVPTNANAVSIIPHSPKKTESPVQKPSIIPPSTPQKKERLTGKHGPGSPSSTPRGKTQATGDEPSTPTKTLGPLTPSTLRSPHPNRKHYTVVRGRRVGVYSSW